MQKSNVFRLVITGVLCGVLLLTIVPRSKTIWELSQRKHQLEQQQALLEQTNKEKQKELDELSSPEAIERIAREQLGMVKDGERIVLKLIHEK